MATNKVTTNVIDMSGNTGALVWAKGTTAQRPGSPVSGDTRYNTTDNKLEFYNGTDWSNLNEGTSLGAPGTQNAEVFMVGGGGGGGAQNNQSGDYPGGGAGGYTTTTATLSLFGSVTVNVGAGGTAGVVGVAGTGGTGGTTSIINNGTTYSITGGTGGLQSYDGGNGGSGGGTANTGAGGTDGGNGGASDGTTKGVGQGTTTREFADAARTLYSGGGGSGRWSTPTPGGAGGGGDGQSDNYNLGGGQPGTDGLGGGGGGRATYPTPTPAGGLPGFAGGSGKVVVRVNKSGITGNINGYDSTNSDATYDYYEFDSSGTLEVTQP